MDTTSCTTIVLVLLWISLCLQALASLVAPIRDYTTTLVLPTTTTLSTVLLALCLWQCKKAGYLVSPMTWYHWALLILLVLLQVMAVVLEQEIWGIGKATSADSTYPIYGIAVLLWAILGCTLFCGWKCNLFCRPCCKSQYICYGSAVVVVLVVLTVLAVTALLAKHGSGDGLGVFPFFGTLGQTEKDIIQYLGNLVVPIIQCYTMAFLWTTLLKLPYTFAEVVALIASALAVASMVALALAVPGSTQYYGGLSSTTAYPLLALHLGSLGITLYYLQYKDVFHWPNDTMCFGVLAVVQVAALVAMAIVMANSNGHRPDEGEALKYTLLGYSIVLMVPTLWYAYRCGLLKWCLPKKKGLKGTASAEYTAADTDIATE